MSGKDTEEITFGSVRLNSSITKIWRLYRPYLDNCIMNLEPIMGVEQFYWWAKDNFHIRSSRTFEAYIRQIAIKEAQKPIVDYKSPYKSKASVKVKVRPLHVKIDDPDEVDEDEEDLKNAMNNRKEY